METLTLLTWGYDGLLGLGLLWLAWQALSCPDLFRAIVLFVAFGLLMALAWVRLEAPDVALAEAAIGAGLTGALLLAALARLHAVTKGEQPDVASDAGEQQAGSARWLPGGALLLVAGGLGYVMWSLPPSAPGLSAAVSANIHASGVINPVTAVLLNFRGYDTLLEMVVLWLALLGVWSIGGVAHAREQAPGPVLEGMSLMLVPVMMLVAAYLLWVGAHAPGGAFQAGAVLGAAGVLLSLSARRPGLVGLPLRLALVLGPGVFVVVAVLTLVGGRLLELPPEHAGMLILVLEAAATISIGVTLAALFLGGKPSSTHQERR